jgi:hypothetical protein
MLIVAQIENPPHCMQPEGLNVTTPGIGPCSVPDESNPLPMIRHKFAFLFAFEQNIVTVLKFFSPTNALFIKHIKC